MESVSGSDVRLPRVGDVELGHRGMTIIRAREKPMVRWSRGMAHHCQTPHGHGTATSGVHMGIIVKFSEALPCVKSHVSRTAGAIFVVT